MGPTVILCWSPRAEAGRIGRLLLEERLAACVDRLPASVAIFGIPELLSNEDAVALLVTTSENLVGDVYERLIDLFGDSIVLTTVATPEAGYEYSDWVETVLRRELKNAGRFVIAPKPESD